MALSSTIASGIGAAVLRVLRLFWGKEHKWSADIRVHNQYADLRSFPCLYRSTSPPPPFPSCPPFPPAQLAPAAGIELPAQTVPELRKLVFKDAYNSLEEYLECFRSVCTIYRKGGLEGKGGCAGGICWRCMALGVRSMHRASSARLSPQGLHLFRPNWWRGLRTWSGCAMCYTCVLLLMRSRSRSLCTTSRTCVIVRLGHTPKGTRRV